MINRFVLQVINRNDSSRGQRKQRCSFCVHPELTELGRTELTVC
ncbi:hypothetical protein D918_05787 [Trichuris suis]|nr:hypothetical protein D918_05787 [Trichuris suis]